ncbi:MAG: 4Fe-4S dicluster domain-containing protein [Candidatus Abyssobacteria bacterium SURF_5]|uniref:4Fe-4S dicluster domain-containing protein n=1 Tax=Abyssobacteria bacterium (strain SURF_5) TaxID=2093360 RepID=A0A3A4NT55_ABYX5|nr:MAG: 4Fe-4S dicluster domain-containing protein [Candidatus Abyssubacteria bacterium SURF_5]
MNRREFLKATALAGAATVVPTGRSGAALLLKHLIPVEELIPGVSYWRSSTCNECPAGCGVRVRLINSNATKIEGNAQHPVNHGGLCARGQSALQGLYSPRRVQSPLRRTESGELEALTWQAALEVAGTSPKEGKIVIVGRHVTGAMQTLLQDLTSDAPELEHLIFEALEYPFVSAANNLSFGIKGIPIYQFEHARLILSFGADFLETWLSPVSCAHGFAATRSVTDPSKSRFIQFESHWSLTGANADERFSIPPGTDLALVGAIAAEVISDAITERPELQKWRDALEPFSVEKASKATGLPAKTIRNVAVLLRSRKPSLVLAGGPTSRTTHATALQVLVNLINYAAGNYGKTVSFNRYEHSPVGSYRDMLKTVEEMEKGEVGALIVHDTSLEFAFADPDRLRTALANVPLKIKLATVIEESSSDYDLILPILHWIETWDLVEPRTGINCVRQPIIQPFTDSLHAGQVLADLVQTLSGKGKPSFNYVDFVQTRWQEVRKKTAPDQSFDAFWKTALEQGGIWLPADERAVTLLEDAAATLNGITPDVTSEGSILIPIATVRYGDGRHTDKPWLNELPDPITTIAWDNPLLISPAMAERWNCKPCDIVRVSVGGKTLEAPVALQEGTHDGVIAFPIGAAGEYMPFHAYPKGNPFHALGGEIDPYAGSLAWTAAPVEFAGVIERVPLARIQGSFEQGEREIAQAVVLTQPGELQENHKEEAPHAAGELYPEYAYPIHKWAMVIDLNLCIGCGACAVACQAENNVFVVGKEQCLRGRKLSWLRIQRLADKGLTIFQPMLCQHCGHAPCETVCPVYASVHNSEGLNVQIYNRCVGTRYCANNCPYKVRRFNWFTYKYPPPLQRQFNPFVSVRTRGTMEKCTFCIQRIRELKEIAKDENRPLRDGEIVPACAQSCPTHAIRFGDLRDPDSWIAKHVADRRGYVVLEHLNTQPSITYLKKIVSQGTLSADTEGSGR